MDLLSSLKASTTQYVSQIQNTNVASIGSDVGGYLDSLGSIDSVSAGMALGNLTPAQLAAGATGAAETVQNLQNPQSQTLAPQGTAAQSVRTIATKVATVGTPVLLILAAVAYFYLKGK